MDKKITETTGKSGLKNRKNRIAKITMRSCFCHVFCCGNNIKKQFKPVNYTINHLIVQGKVQSIGKTY